MRRLSTLILCLLVLPGTTTALAQEQVAPPGNAGVDEYLETIPEADGNRPARPSGDGGGEPQSALDAQTRQDLEDLGADGAAAARLADEAARAAGDRPKGSGGTESAGSADSLDGAGGSGLGAVLAQTVNSDDGGMGVALPILLLITLVGAAALLVIRRRGGQR